MVVVAAVDLGSLVYTVVGIIDQSSPIIRIDAGNGGFESLKPVTFMKTEIITKTDGN